LDRTAAVTTSQLFESIAHQEEKPGEARDGTQTLGGETYIEYLDRPRPDVNGDQRIGNLIY